MKQKERIRLAKRSGIRLLMIVGISMFFPMAAYDNMCQSHIETNLDFETTSLSKKELLGVKNTEEQIGARKVASETGVIGSVL